MTSIARILGLGLLLATHQWPCSVGAARSARPLKQTAIIVFGDSLSDNGNFWRATNKTLPLPSATFNGTKRNLYWQGRFTNSPGMWNDWVLKQVKGSVAYNFAYAGATLCPDLSATGNLSFIPSVSKQVATYIKTKQTDKAFRAQLAQSLSVPVIWAGTNDVQVVAATNLPGLFTIATQLSTCAKNVSRALLSSGEKVVVLASMAPLDLTPFIIGVGLSKLISPIIASINAALAKTVKELQLEYKDQTILYWDCYEDLSYGITNYKEFGFKYNSTFDCLSVPPSYSAGKGKPPPTVCQNPDQYLFWDDVHPTSKGHKLVTESFMKLYNSSLVNANV